MNETKTDFLKAFYSVVKRQDPSKMDILSIERSFRNLRGSPPPYAKFGYRSLLEVAKDYSQLFNVAGNFVYPIVTELHVDFPPEYPSHPTPRPETRRRLDRNSVSSESSASISLSTASYPSSTAGSISYVSVVSCTPCSLAYPCSRCRLARKEHEGHLDTAVVGGKNYILVPYDPHCEPAM